MMAAEGGSYEDKTYQEWLADALAQDGEAWEALERQLSRLRRKREGRSEDDGQEL